jgi:hypothetical protein
MLAVKEQRPAIRTLEGWAISVLLEVGAIENARTMVRCGTAPHARERAFDLIRSNPSAGASAQTASVAIADVLASLGDTCSECPPV